MKKLLLFIFLFFFSINVNAKTITVKFKSCSDGDTAHFTYNTEDIKARFIGIDTPELEHNNQEYEYYANEAKDYTCNKLKEAKVIKLEYDDKAGEKDKYERHLVYVWIDNTLLNEDLVFNGYAEAKYIYDNYKYKDRLIKAEEHAKANKLGIWKDYSNIPSNSNNPTSNESNTNIEETSNDINVIYIVFAIIILIILMPISKTIRNSVFRYIKRKIK